LAGVGDQLGTIFGKGIAKVEDTFVVSMLADCSKFNMGNAQGTAHPCNQMSRKGRENVADSEHAERC